MKRTAVQRETEVSLDLIQAHRMMRTIRTFEETALQKSNEDVVKGSLHLYVGMEAIAAGVFPNLRSGDWFASTHRGHGHALASGVPTVRMFAELFGRQGGVCDGKAGSMHMADLSRGYLGGTGIIGASIHLASGAAMTCQAFHTGAVSVAFFGDGAANRGTFHEGLNLASLWNLPVVFICENNGFGQWTRHEHASAIATVAERASAYGIPGQRCDGNDVVAVFEATRDAVQRARAGKGPTLLEFVSYRLRDHSGGRDQRKYRDRSEIERWREHDPLLLSRSMILERNLATADVIDQLERAADEDVTRAAEEAERYPVPSTERALGDVTDYG
jgi:acetoin:2,6-dichlorophenolindophenol oxidoreductase subunit alpha